MKERLPFKAANQFDWFSHANFINLSSMGATFIGQLFQHWWSESQSSEEVLNIKFISDSLSWHIRFSIKSHQNILQIT